VFQMLELDHTSGVVLMPVGPEPDSPLAKDSEYQCTIRMYTLASLVSLAKWAVANRCLFLLLSRLELSQPT
jgi:hypothetical protein